jgi:hypothetical protein
VGELHLAFASEDETIIVHVLAEERVGVHLRPPAIGYHLFACRGKEQTRGISLGVDARQREVHQV